MTILPAVAAFDDACWCFAAGLVPGLRLRAALEGRLAAHACACRAAEHRDAGAGAGAGGAGPMRRAVRVAGRLTRLAASLLFASIVVQGSIPVIANLLQLRGRQHMNTSFGAFSLVNTYGAFGSVGKERLEVVLSGTNQTDPRTGQPVPGSWREYNFKCKPGDVSRRPCWLAPWHYRQDWVGWFAGFQNYQQHPWLLHLAGKLMAGGDHAALASGLLASGDGGDPFRAWPDDPPKFIKADRFLYRYSKPGSQDWWTREKRGEYFPPINLKNPSLQEFFKGHGWPEYHRASVGPPTPMNV